MATRLNMLFTLAVPLAIAGAGAVYLLDPAGGGNPSLVYETVAASKGSIRKLVTTSGPVRALVTVSVGSQLSGNVDAVKVDFNSEVRPNDILATLDDKTFAAKVAQARADVAAAEAALANQRAALTKAEAVLKNAERATDRQTTLASKGFAAQSALDTAVRDMDVAKADIAVANAQITSAEATIAQKRAALKQAEVDLERTAIRSPIEGTVISRTVDPGQTVAASLQAPELFKIAQDLSRVRIEAQVNEADVGAVEKGNTATFTVDAYPDRQFQGQVTQVRLAATELNGVVTYTVIVEADNPNRKLFPGMTANVAIESAKRDDVVRVPNDVFRYRPRNQASERGGGERSAKGGERGGGERMLEALKRDVHLTEDQERTVRETLDKARAEQREGQGGVLAVAPDPATMRQRSQARIEQALGPLLSDTQRPLFEAWKQKRESVRSAPLYVTGSGKEPERRMVRVGLADDQFTEVVSGLTEGEKVVLRAREAKP